MALNLRTGETGSSPGFDGDEGILNFFLSGLTVSGEESFGGGLNLFAGGISRLTLPLPKALTPP
jgi:hypothetical protein